MWLGAPKSGNLKVSQDLNSDSGCFDTVKKNGGNQEHQHFLISLNYQVAANVLKGNRIEGRVFMEMIIC